MAVTNTEHPPAAATVLGMAIQPIDLLRIAVFIAAIILLAAIHFRFKSRLRDLIKEVFEMSLRWVNIPYRLW